VTSYYAPEDIADHPMMRAERELVWIPEGWKPLDPRDLEHYRLGKVIRVKAFRPFVSILFR
jgi:hypothetical protein